MGYTKSAAWMTAMKAGMVLQAPSDPDSLSHRENQGFDLLLSNLHVLQVAGVLGCATRIQRVETS